MEDKLPQLSKAKDLCQQLCDNTKDLSTKTDLRTKMAALDKDFSDTLKKLGNFIISSLISVDQCYCK